MYFVLYHIMFNHKKKIKSNFKIYEKHVGFEYFDKLYQPLSPLK